MSRVNIAEILNSLYKWLEQPENVIPALFWAFVIYILSQFVLAHYQHKADRRKYKYERSSSTGKMRFEKETFHLEKVSSALLELITLTESFIDQENIRWISKRQREEWLRSYRETIKTLGAAAPFLNFIDLKNGIMECGVKDNFYQSNLGLEGLRGSENLVSQIRELDGRSLYIRCALLIDACADEFNKKTQISAGMILGEKCLKEETDRTKGMSLQERYWRFLNCAYCRLRDCETGSRDARHQRFKSWVKSFPIALFPSIYHKFDPRCPYEECRPCKGNTSEHLNFEKEGD